MRLVKSLVERCFDLITLLSEQAETLPLGEIARRLDLPKSATHRLLATFCELGWAEQDPATGFYRLSLRLAITGQRLLVGTRIPDICQPVLDELARATESLGRLAIAGADGLTWIAHSQGARSGLVYQPELVARVPLHATANGKAWLATLPRNEALRRATESGLGQPGIGGPRAIRTRETFSAALDETAERGWAIAQEEAEPGVGAIAAPIFQAGIAVGTVSIAGPIHRFAEPALARIAAQVCDTARRLSEVWPYRVSLVGPSSPEPAVPVAVDQP
ncbi:IclR family transcriptional regulator [Labrys wisconsinensis]|uniref:DNA-binding IclR family transcriptional regulator n=1 Tax=Labrys wisconsinensis TaxID=425677 RepID=A0ABU0J291_9HYPH|nr:IclR family transcriptional regulator [Labrys wisconsinensis]MDQ0467686.1 DNA-binding IclR family transcriptional regulator [Labrys wisconsinensis]